MRRRNGSPRKQDRYSGLFRVALQSPTGGKSVGQQAECTARFGGRVSTGKALLESSALIFRGDFRLAIPFQAIASVTAVNGELHACVSVVTHELMLDAQ